MTVLTDALCDTLCQAAKEESQRLGIEISFAVADEKGIPLYFKRMGDALIVTVTLVPKKAYTAAVLRTPSGDLAQDAVENKPLFTINTTDPNLTLLGGGFPLFHDGKCVGAIAVGGGTPAQDVEIAQHVVKVFEAQTAS